MRASLFTPELPTAEAPETLIAALERAATSPRANSHGLRFVDLRERQTPFLWSEVVARAQRTAHLLRSLGLEAGDRVAIVFSTCPQFFDAFFGALLAGAVPVPLYPPVRLGRMDEYDRRTAVMLEVVQARLVLVEARILRLLGGVEARCSARLGFWTLERLREEFGAHQPGSRSAVTTSSLLSASRRHDDLALVQFSSGTTLSPKPIALSHRALLYQGSILAGHWPADDVRAHAGVSWLPLYHDMGLIGCVIPALLRTVDLWLIPPELFVARPALWLRTLSRSGASVSPAPNFAYGLCVDRIRDSDLEGVDLSAWQTALNGAEAVSPLTLRAFCRRFGRFGFSRTAMTPVYGLAEAALAVTFSNLDRPWHSVTLDLEELGHGRAVPSKDVVDSVGPNQAQGTDRAAPAHALELVSVGRPVPGFSLEARDELGEILAEGQVGEIWVRGPSLAEGYLIDGRVEPMLEDGWLATGDLGFVLAGELYLTGRAKDIVVVRGRNWSAVPIEEAVSTVDGVRTGCVVAVSGLLPQFHARSGESPEQPGTLRSAHESSREELWVFAETRVPRSEHEDLERRCVESVRRALGLEVGRLDLLEPGELPRTSSGKLRRGETHRLALAGSLAGAGRAPWIERWQRAPRVQAALALVHSQRRALRGGNTRPPGEPSAKDR